MIEEKAFLLVLYIVCAVASGYGIGWCFGQLRQWYYEQVQTRRKRKEWRDFRSGNRWPGHHYPGKDPEYHGGYPCGADCQGSCSETTGCYLETIGEPR